MKIHERTQSKGNGTISSSPQQGTTLSRFHCQRAEASLIKHASYIPSNCEACAYVNEKFLLILVYE